MWCETLFFGGFGLYGLILQIHAKKPLEVRVQVGVNICLYVLLYLRKPMRQQLIAILLPYINTGGKQLKNFNSQGPGKGNQGFIAYPCPAAFNAIDHLYRKIGHFRKFFL